MMSDTEIGLAVPNKLIKPPPAKKIAQKRYRFLGLFSSDLRQFVGVVAITQFLAWFRDS